MPLSVPVSPAPAVWTYTPTRALTDYFAHFEKSFAGDEYFADINVITADQSLGSQTFNVTLPSDATIVAAIAVALIQIMNDVATVQKIDVKLEVDGNVVFNQSDCVGLAPADAASATFTIVQDVTSIITTTGNHILQGKVTLSDAHSTHFTTQYALIVLYRKS